MAKKRKKSKDDFVVADFGHKDAKGGGGSIRLPEGDYVAKIVGATKGEAKSSGNTMITWELKITKSTTGKGVGKTLKTRTVLTPTALFMLRQLLEALGQEVPEKASKIRYQKYIGKEVGITLEDNTFESNGKERTSSDVSTWLDPDLVGADEDDEDDEDDESDEDDEDDDEDDDDDDDDEEDLDEVDLDEL